MLVPNPKGSYYFLPGIEPYSSGVAAYRDYEIVHVRLRQPRPYPEGFEFIEDHLRAVGRPRAALCAVELRSPAPFSRAGFIQFNAGYRALLAAWELLLGDRNPVARTNVAPRWRPPDTVSLFGFSYTAPAPAQACRTFVVAGAGELGGGPLLDAPVVRPGEVTPAAMREKAAYVIRVLGRRLEGLGAAWDAVTAVNVYTTQPLDAQLHTVLAEGIGPAILHGVRYHCARPPIDELAFEMDARGVRTELCL